MGNDALDDLTMFEIISRHPLVRVATIGMIPYLIYVSSLYLQLQHPEYITKFTGGLIHPRPAVHGKDIPRQVLIVYPTPGTTTRSGGQSLSSGSAEMSMQLRKKLSLEIGHGYSDAAWRFARDGTISWVHGIRFLSQPEDMHGKIESVMKICNSGIASHTEMGFHPSAFGPPKNMCSYLVKWNKCWKKECYLTLLKEWGCGLSNTCGEVKFASTVLHVRNPMTMLEGLVKEYCIGEGVDGTVSNSFLVYASAIFPSHDFYADSCIEAIGTFLVMYLESMLEAKQKGYIDALYQIEQSSVCDVAKLAGLLSENSTVYGPNHVRISNLCDKDNIYSPAQQIVAMDNRTDNYILTFGWEDVRGGIHGSKRKLGDNELELRLKNLFIALDYNLASTPVRHKPDGDESRSEL